MIDNTAVELVSACLSVGTAGRLRYACAFGLPALARPLNKLNMLKEMRAILRLYYEVYVI